MMYLNSKNIRIGDVMHELTARAYLNNLFLDIPSTNNIEDTSKQQIHYLGVVSGKHYQLIDKAIPQVLGI